MPLPRTIEQLRTPTYTNQTSLTGAVNSFPSTLIPNAPLKEMTLYSQTVNSLVTNGNFADTTGWSATSSTIATSNNILSITGNGAGNDVYVTQTTTSICSTNKKIFVRMRARVTNTNSTSIYTSINGSTSGTPLTISTVSSPVQNQWYDVSGVVLQTNQVGNLLIRLRHTYADAATANGKAMEVKEVMAIDMGTSASDNPDYNLTAAQMDAKYPNWLSYGIKSTFGGRETIVGKNLFDKGKALTGYYWSSTNTLVAESTSIYSNEYIKVKPNTSYSITRPQESIQVMEFDNGKNFIQRISLPSTTLYTSGSNVGYIRLSWFRVGLSNVNILQLELGSTATAYEPYQSQQVYYPDLGYSLPNGIKNEFDLVSGKFVRNTQGYILQASDITGYTTSLVNIDQIEINKKTDYIFYNQDPSDLNYTIFFPGFKASGVVYDNLSSIGLMQSSNNTKIKLGVAKGTYANLAAAQAALAGTQIIYQLATPVVTYYPPQPINARPNGTVYLENVIHEAKVYAESASVTDTTKTIQSLASVTKIVTASNGTEVRTDIPTSTCTISTDKLSFTSTALVNSDMVEFDYYYDSSSTTLPTETYTASNNLNAAMEMTTSNITKLNTKVEDITDYIATLDQYNTLNDQKIYGLKWNPTTDVYTRLLTASVMSQSQFSNAYPWSAMRRCTVDDEMNVLFYRGETGYVEDGSAGQVMVEIPKFYYRTEVNTTTGDISWFISPWDRSGYKLHPAFVRNGLINDFVYISAFEGCAFDVTANASELNTITVTAGASADGNLTITLDGNYAFTVAVTNGMTTSQVGDAIRAAGNKTSYQGTVWTVGGSGATVTYTSSTVGLKTTLTVGVASTGVTASVVKTTSGAGGYTKNDSAGVSFTATTGDKLSSVAGVKPISGWKNTLTIANARQLAKNRGAKWEQLTFNIVSAVQLLYLIEYASFNSQSKIGDGIATITDDSATNMAINTGATSSLGNASGKVANTHYQTGQSNFAVSYRGIENFWGNLWSFVDGLSIKADRNPWIADNGFVSDTFSGVYNNTGLTLSNTNGYASNIALSKTWDYMFLPSSVSGGSSSTKLCDYYYQTTGNRIALLGGAWSDGGVAGCFSFVLNFAASFSSRIFGSRLCGFKR